jgi:hypothetical protein
MLTSSEVNSAAKCDRSTSTLGVDTDSFSSEPHTVPTIKSSIVASSALISSI